MMIIKIEYTRTYRGHKKRYQNRKNLYFSRSKFSSFSYYKMDVPTLIEHRRVLRNRDPAKFEQLLKKLKPIEEKLNDLNEESQVLQEDRVKITTSIRTASNISTGHNSSIEDTRVWHELSEHYSSFFDHGDSEGEEPAMSTLNDIMKLKSYIKHEQKANKKQISALIAKADRLKNEWQKDVESSLLAPSVEETGSISGPSVEKTGSISASSVEETRSIGRSFSVEKGESSKRKSDYISDSDDSSVSSSSKKSRPTPGNYIDDLPELPYNPFDDLD